MSSFDGYVGSDTSAGDGQAVTSDANSNDALAVESDARGATDASDASKPSVDAAAPPFCASLSPKPTFCADFDESTSVAAGFTTPVRKPNPGTSPQSVDTTTFVSAPGSALLTLKGGNVGSGLLSLLQYQLPGPVKQLHLAYKVKLVASDPSTAVLLSQISIQQSDGYYGLTIYQRPSGAAVQEQIIVDGGGQSYPEYPIGPGVTAGSGWVDADIRLDLFAGKMVVTFAGSTLSRDVDPSGQPGNTSFSIGVGYYSGSTVQASAANFDNVVLTVQ